MIPRILSGALVLILNAVLVKLFMIGQSFNEPITGIRKGFIYFFYKFTARWLLGVTLGCWWCTNSYLDPAKGEVDYSDYIGEEANRALTLENSKKRTFVDKDAGVKRKVSMVVSNHIGFVDVLALIYGPVAPGFAPKITL